MCRQFRRTVATLCTITCGLAIMAGVSTCSAATIIGDPVKLSSLLTPGGTIGAGDKTFTNFTYSFTGDMPDPVSVNVIPITDDFGNFGIRFQGAFIDTTGVAGGSDALITYTVTAALGRLISDAHLQGNPSLLGQFGSMSVTETFLPLSQVPPYRMRIYDDQNLGTKMVDSTAFTPTQSLNVQKDILGLAKINPNDPEGPSTVTLSFVDQTFSQIIIPEPTAGLLLACAGVGLAMARRRYT